MAFSHVSVSIAHLAGTLHPKIDRDTLMRMVDFLATLHIDANVKHSFASTGGPWEFNLRDLLRWCELVGSRVEEALHQAAVPDLAALVPACADVLFVERMRTSADRDHIRAVFRGTFDCAIAPQPAAMLITPYSVTVGRTRLARASMPESAEAHYVLSNSRLPLLSCLAESVSQQWMCLLVGPSACGKTAAVRTLARLAGRSLVEMSLTTGTDTSDLLGGYEQLDPNKRGHLLKLSVDAVLAAMAGIALAGGEVLLAEQLDAVAQSASHLSRSAEALADLAEGAGALLVRLRSLLAQMSASVPDAERASQLLSTAQARVDDALSVHSEATGKFVWVDGVLTR